MMSLEVALRRLSLRPASICRQCRRTLASSAITRQSATATFAESLTSDRTQVSSNGPAHSRMSALSGNQPSMLGRTTSEPDRLVPRTSYDVAEEAITPIAEAQKRKAAEQRAQRIAQPWDRGDLEKQVFRRWKAGDVYAPHDLTGVEQAKWKKLRRKGRSRMDVLDQLNINPIQHYKNFSMMSEYMSEMGRIKHSNETGLRPVNQRKMAKAIRRAKGVGLMPGVHRHPEILRIEINNRDRQARL